MQNTRRFLGTG